MKSKLTAILLCFFLGSLGIHRFYLGYTIIGVIQPADFWRVLNLGNCRFNQAYHRLIEGF